MDLLGTLLAAAALFALTGTGLLLILSALVREGAQPGLKEIGQFIRHAEIPPIATLQSGDVSPDVEHPPEWLRVPGWLVTRLEEEKTRSGALLPLDSYRLAALYVKRVTPFILILGCWPLLLAIAARVLGAESGLRLALAIGGVTVVVGGLLVGSLHTDLVKHARERLDQMRTQLPYAADFFALVLEAGGSLDDAVEAYLSYAPEGALRDALHLVLQELRSGATREEAFSRFAIRSPLREIERLATAIVQAARAGSPLTEVFREQAELLRMERLQRATATAEKMAVNSHFPLAGVVISLILVLVAPYFIKAVPDLVGLFR